MQTPSTPPAHLMLSRSRLDREGLRRDDPELLSQLLSDPATRVLHLRGERMPVQVRDGSARLALRSPQQGDDQLRSAYLGRVDDHQFLALFDDPETTAVDRGATDPDELGAQALRTHRSLRSLAPVLPVEDLGVATTAVAMANWISSVHFCVRCGEPVVAQQHGWRLACPQGHYQFPRTDAAVIMSVTDPDDRLLLAAGTRFVVPTGVSVLAGFLEPGESLEAAVAREVMEEVGVVVDDVEYVGNQPWPMPASLMIGFAARTRQTRLTLDPHEIRHARWFSRDELDESLQSGEVTVPPRLSIARHLIERWYGRPLPDQPGDVS